MPNTASSLTKSAQFAVPPAAVARHPDTLLVPRRLRAWIDGLPMANPPRASQMLLQQLRMVTRDPNPGPKLGQLLAQYDTPLEQLLPFTTERLIESPDHAEPLDQLEYLLVEMLTELAYGYLRIANGVLAAGRSPDIETLYRAIHLLEAATNIERLHHHRLAPDNWRTVLKIFLLADQQGMAQQPVKVSTRSEGEPDTVQGLFFRAFLISLCDPHSHRPGEVAQWLLWLGSQSSSLGLTVLPQGAHSIPLDTSGELTPLASARRSKPGPDMRYLAIDELLQKLRDAQGVPAGLHAALSPVLKGRKTTEQRQNPRQPRNHPYRLLSGLGAIHARLSQLTQGVAAQASDPGGIPCLQVNQSSSGAAFHLPGPLNPPLCVGEPVLAEADTPAGGAAIGFTGRIRRLVSEGDRVEIGVEKTLGRLIPVTVTGGPSERRLDDSRALLLHASDGGRYTLLAARALYREGETVTVQGPNIRYTLRLVGLEGVVRQNAFIKVEPVG